MNSRVWFRILGSALLTFSLAVGLFVRAASASGQETRQARGRFVCGTDSRTGSPATIASNNNPDRGEVVLIIWQTTSFGEQWDPQTRCQTVSERFQTNNQNGTLRYILAGELNGYPVLCAATRAESSCNSDNLLITLERGSDPQQELQKLSDLNGGVASPPVVSDGVFVTIGDQIIGIDVYSWIDYLATYETSTCGQFWGC